VGKVKDVVLFWARKVQFAGLFLFSDTSYYLGKR
jgi:hypothetical protein